MSKDVGVTASHNPFVNTAPVEDNELSHVIDLHPTFAECLDNSNCIVAHAGINVDEHDFSVWTWINLMQPRMLAQGNVQTRTQHGQDPVIAPVDLNLQMEAKFLDLWASKANPSSGVGTKEWITWAAFEYEK